MSPDVMAALFALGVLSIALAAVGLKYLTRRGWATRLRAFADQHL